jgi:hypothetical protein
MFKKVRRVVMVAALIGVIACIVLLLNFTAFNPTHRRYSSDSPRTTGDIGTSAEFILSKDLDLPRNDQTGQLVCVCGRGVSTGRCNSCAVKLPTISTFAVPDFISKKAIVEVKNTKKLYYPAEFEQLETYAEAAKELKIPLWLYVRVNTDVSREYYTLTKSTGGGVVHYFTYPGYKDPTDRAALFGLVICACILVSATFIEIPRRGKTRPEIAKRSVDDTEEFVQRVRSRAQSEIDRDK